MSTSLFRSVLKIYIMFWWKGICSTVLSRKTHFVTSMSVVHRLSFEPGLNKWVYFMLVLSDHSNVQLTLVISKLKGPSETLRDIRSSTYQNFKIEENTNCTANFHKWICNKTPLVKNIYWKYCGKWEKLLLRSNFSSYPQNFVTWC